MDAEKPLWEGHRLLREVDWVLNESPEAAWLDWLRARVGPETLIVQNLCGWEGHDANVRTKLEWDQKTGQWSRTMGLALGSGAWRR